MGFEEISGKSQPAMGASPASTPRSRVDGCLPSEYLVADEAPAHSLRYDEDLANGVCAGGRGAIFLSAHDFPPVLGSPDAELRARRLQTPACS
jgi:hypothetical protein